MKIYKFRDKSKKRVNKLKQSSTNVRSNNAQSVSSATFHPNSSAKEAETNKNSEKEEVSVSI